MAWPLLGRMLRRRGFEQTEPKLQRCKKDQKIKKIKKRNENLFLQIQILHSESSCIRMPLDSLDFEAAAAMASKRRNRLRQRRPHRPGSKRKQKSSNRSHSFWGGQDWHGLKRERQD